MRNGTPDSGQRDTLCASGAFSQAREQAGQMDCREKSADCRAGGPCPTSPRSPGAHCPVETSIGLIGGKYKALILWKLTGETLRFSALRREVPGATPKMLTQQLRELERDGLVRREVYAEVPPKVEYSLTALGESLRPLLESMYAWGADYLRGQGLAVNCPMTPPGSFRQS